MSMDQWKEQRLLKKAKKQSVKELMTKGYSKKEGRKIVKDALRRIVKKHEEQKENA